MVKKGAVKKRELLKAKSAREVKKAQLFIIAAVIIVGVLFSLFAVTNYVKTKPKPTAFYDLSEELSSESSQVIDYATYTQGDANSLVQDFSQKYADYCCNSTSNDVELVFVYGNSGQLTMMNYSTTQTVTSGGELGGTSASVTTTTREPQITNIPSDAPINVTIGNVTYNFQLSPGENFFFVIQQAVVLLNLIQIFELDLLQN